MPIRISGLTSGLDTESIVGALVSAYSYKKDKYTKAQTKLTWKQDAWKTLNSKVYNLYTDIGNLRYSSSYSLKKSTISDTSKAKATASGSAINGTQTLEIKNLAKTAYITGGKLADGVTGDTKLSDLGVTFGQGDVARIQIKTQTATEEIELDGSTTIDGLMNKFNEKGLQANFDSKNGRIFISAKESGADGNFELSANNNLGLTSLAQLGLLSSKEVSNVNTTDSIDGLISKKYGTMYGTASSFKSLLEYVKTYKSSSSTEDEKTEAHDKLELEGFHDDMIEDITSKYGINWDTIDDAGLSTLAKNIYDNEAEYADYSSSSTTTNVKSVIQKVQQAYTDLANAMNATYDSETEMNNAIAAAQTALDNVRSANSDWVNYIEQNFGYQNSEEDSSYSDFWLQADKDELAQSASNKVNLTYQVASGDVEIDTSNVAEKIDGEDAVIVLNNVEYTGSGNNITVNGLTIEAMALTTDPITVTIQDDTDAIYDKVKDFLSEYNNVINEMQKLYNADSAKDYEPLTDDEKAEMSETEIEKWEQKIKDSLLRRDTSLSSLISTMTMGMMKTYDVNGKTYSLSSFGIHTLGSLNAEKNENYAYHIDGDSEDNKTSGNKDKLRTAIAEDPDAVIEFLKQLTSGLYSDLDKKMKSTAVKSVYTVYNDKEMASEYSNYSKLIKTWTDRITDMEDSYYKKFSKMESALAKLQNNSSSITSMLGGG